MTNSNTINEQTAIEECKKQNRFAQKYFFDRYAEQMMLLCLRYIKDQEDAREVLLDAFYKFFKNIDGFTWQGEGSVSAWLKKIVINQCLMQLRKRKDMVISTDEPELYEDVSDMEDAVDHMSAKEIMALVHGLPSGYRAVFNLYVFEGMTHKEIGVLLDISENTSKSQLHKAKAMLKQQLMNVHKINR